MGNIKEVYFKLTSAQLAAMLIVLLVIEGGLMYKFALEPRIAGYKSAKADLAQKKTSIEGQQANIDRLKKEITGEPGEVLKPGDLEMLAGKGNSTLAVSQKDALIDELKRVAEAAGGKNVKVSELPLRDTFISVGNKNRVFKAKTLPLRISMSSNFAGASNFMFQLKSLERMLKLTGFELNSENYEGGLRATANIDAYLAEDM